MSMFQAPYGKRVVTLKGHPQVNEDGSATTTIVPGYLVQGVSSVAPHATAGGNNPRAIALEKSEMGTGIDSTFSGTNSGTGSPNYASGDKVKVGVFAPGMRFVGWINSGQVISENSFLESAGDGTFRIFGSGTVLARALEAVTASATTKIALEAM